MNYEELIKKIEYYNHLYYDLHRPEISDAAFDVLYDKLEEIEATQGWAASNSPTLKVGGTPGKIKHPIRLYSLKKVYNKSEIDSEFDIETPKIDGTNLTIIYNTRTAKIELALTRGDGQFGDDVTHLAKYLNNVPQQSMGVTAVHKIIITGECVTNNTVENFRNYVSGALGLKNPEEFKTRNISYIVHDILSLDMDYMLKLDLASALGFDTVLDDICDKYPQDGKVYRVNSRKRAEEMGWTSKYPRFAVALKPREKLTAITTLQKVDWQIGRTGTVNPVGIVVPIILDDATISRVTLHNIGIIEQHNLGLGDKIEIERAGGVIPKFLRVIEHSKLEQKITQKDAELAIEADTRRDGPRLYVKNPEEHGTIKLLMHFIKTLGIKGLGEQSIKKMGLMHPIDLYSKQNWSVLGINGEKIEEEIERSKTKPYSLVLAALGIPNVGKSMSEKIVEKIPSFERLHEIEYEKIKSIGPLITEKILSWLDVNEDWVYTLPLQLTQQIDYINFDTKTEKLKVCISGKLDMLKSDLAEILKNHGYEVVESVTKKCNYLITGDTSSTKTTKAESYGIKILYYWANKKDILNGRL